MADKGLPPKSPLMQIRRVAHNRKHQYSSPWIDVEGSTLTDAMMVHLRSTSESHPMARNTDVDKLEGGLAHLDKGHLKTTADKTGPPPSLDHNNSSSEGEVVTGSSSKDDVVEDEKSACKINGGSGSNMDPRRVKRILANRLSAQRSRLKKTQYIRELERSVSELEAEIQLLSPQVAYYENQRRSLNAENSVMKQRIAALMHEKVFKDAEFDALRLDGERFNQFTQIQEHEQQQQYMMMGFGFDDTQNMKILDPLNFIYD
ncbi:hypothetical protein MRB53_000639 [Persea americana]|uniref:Uncharacterized protein n=1 Tax=Persea americana TaxID=3435 RepID=A0ACC2MQB6_PERAE|nr:hypothetical protein MRB53_000639 [Persea americana]